MQRSPQAARLAWAMRLAVRPALRWSTHVGLARKALDVAARRWMSCPDDIRCETVLFEGDARVFPALCLTPRRPSRGSIIHFHGGGYIAGSPQTHLGLAAALAEASGHSIYLPELPLAPEHPFPAAFEAALGFWQALRHAGHEAGDLAFGGDSAGGGLALALAAHLGPERPAALYGLSPWCDLTFSGASMIDNKHRDPIFPASRAPFLADLVLQGESADDPRISPIFADLVEPAPLWLSVSATEIIRDDAHRMADRHRKAGGQVSVVEREGLVHAWPYFTFLPEARQDIATLGRFLHGQLKSVTG